MAKRKEITELAEDAMDWLASIDEQDRELTPLGPGCAQRRVLPTADEQ